MGEYGRVKDKNINQINGSSELNITYSVRNVELGTVQANGAGRGFRVKIEAWYQPNFAFHSVVVSVYPDGDLPAHLLRCECGPAFGLAECVAMWRAMGVPFCVVHSVFKNAQNGTRPLCGECCPVECRLPLRDPLASPDFSPAARPSCLLVRKSPTSRTRGGRLLVNSVDVFVSGGYQDGLLWCPCAGAIVRLPVRLCASDCTAILSAIGVEGGVWDTEYLGRNRWRVVAARGFAGKVGGL